MFLLIEWYSYEERIGHGAGNLVGCLCWAIWRSVIVRAGTERHQIVKTSELPNVLQVC